MHRGVAVLLLLAVTLSSRVGAAVAQQAGADAAGADGICAVRSGPELARALSNESCSVALIMVAELMLTDADWEGITTPVQLARGFVIRGSEALATPPHFRPSAKRKVQLLDGGALRFGALFMTGFRGDNILRAPGMDLLAASPPGTTNATLMATDGVYGGVCFTEQLMGENLRAVPRTIGAVPVGPQRYIYPSLQKGCVNNSDAPPANRCWPLSSNFIDVQTPGLDIDLAGMPFFNGYNLVAMNVTVVCNVVMTEECVTRLGPIGCMLFYNSGGYNETAGPAVLAAASSPPPRQPDAPAAAGATPAVHEGKDGSMKKDVVPVIVGSIVGGVALLLACMSVASVLLMCKQRRLASLRAGGKPVTQAEHRPSKDAHDRCEGGDVHSRSGANTPNAGLSHPGGGIHSTISGLSIMLRPEAPLLAPTKAAAAAAAAATAAGVRKPLSSFPVALPLPPDLASVVTVQTRVQGVGLNVRIVEADGQGSAVDYCRTVTDDAAEDLDGDASGRLGSHLATTSSTTATLGEDVVQLLPKVLGKGAFGKVYVGMFCGQRVAVKMVDQALPFDPQSSWRSSTAGMTPARRGAASGPSAAEAHTRQTFQQELEVMGRCQHPNIVRILAACMEPPRPFLVMELMDIALDKLMYAKGPKLLPLDLVMHIAIEIAQGLAYLHPTIVHRDLKPGNVLINDPRGLRPVVKISDFGLSRLNSTVLVTQSPEAGTPAYVAPECFDVDNNSISYKADMYSFGVLLWEMLAGARPWEGLGAVPIAFQIAFKGKRLPVPPADTPGSSPSRWPPRLCEVLQECWDPTPERRPAAAELAKRLVVMQQKFQASDLEAVDGQERADS